jgi:hypothetical protein
MAAEVERCARGEPARRAKDAGEPLRSGQADCGEERREHLLQDGRLMVGVEAAGVGEQPDARGAERFRLEADLRFAAIEGGAIGLESKESDEAGRVLSDLAGQREDAGA